jgi:hypothetical protein
MRPILTAALLATCATTTTAAQQLPPLIPGVHQHTPLPSTFGHPDDYRLEGLIAGAVLIGGLFTVLVVGFCGQSDSCDSGDAILVSLGTIALGGFTGALIGGAIPKAPSASAAEATRWQRPSDERVLLPGGAAGGALTRVERSVTMPLTHAAAGEEFACSRHANRSCATVEWRYAER